MQLKEQELKQLQDLVEALKALQSQVGSLEYQKHLTIKALEGANEAMGLLRDELRDTYGEVDIDIETGEIKES